MTIVPSNITELARDTLLMDRFHRLLLDVWREACRHIEIAEATDLITPLLLRHLPIDQLLLRVVDLERGVVETVAATARERTRSALRMRTDCSAEAMDRLMQWCRRGELLRDKADVVHGRLVGLVPEGTTGEVLAGPLNTQEGSAGAL